MPSEIETQLDALEENGFLLIEGALSSAETESARQRIEHARQKGWEDGLNAVGNMWFDSLLDREPEHFSHLVGHANVPSRIATDATAMYAKNLLNFVTPLVDAETKALAIDWSDEIIEGCLVTRDGQVVHPDLSIETKATETA